MSIKMEMPFVVKWRFQVLGKAKGNPIKGRLLFSKFYTSSRAI